jgi:ketosteroid isomerase-like protein
MCVSRADDELAIRSLAAAYTDAVNRRDGEGMAAVYAQNGVLHSPAAGAPVEGIEKLRKRFKRLVEKERDFLMQLTHSGVVELYGDTATARWWFSEIKRPAGGTFEMIFGVYQDEVVRTEAGWRFARRTVDASLRWELPNPPESFAPLPLFLPLTGLPKP